MVRRNPTGSNASWRLREGCDFDGLGVVKLFCDNKLQAQQSAHPTESRMVTEAYQIHTNTATSTAWLELVAVLVGENLFD